GRPDRCSGHARRYRPGRGVSDRKILAGFGVTRRRADLLLITAAAVWGVSFVVVKEALASASPLLFLAARFTIATLVLAPLVNVRGGFSRGELRAGLILTLLLASGFATQAYGLQFTAAVRSGCIVALLFLGIMSTVVALVWQFRAQREMSSARASLIFCFEPVFAALTSWLFWGEHFTLPQGLGAALILSGMVLAVIGEARAETPA